MGVKLDSPFVYHMVGPAKTSHWIREAKLVVVSNGTTFLHIAFVAEKEAAFVYSLQGTVHVYNEIDRYGKWGRYDLF